jgi:hypothetical protein
MKIIIRHPYLPPSMPEDTDKASQTEAVQETLTILKSAYRNVPPKAILQQMGFAKLKLSMTGIFFLKEC